jgi:hypothetical protein
MASIDLRGRTATVPGRRRAVSRLLRVLASGATAVALASTGSFAVQDASPPSSSGSVQLQQSIDQLGDLDYATRTAAARTIRRTPPAQAVPVLLQAASAHADGYVRYRALVLLTGFDDPRTTDVMRESLKSPNDRLRAIGYAFFERAPEPSLVPQFLAALGTEQGEFVRPALVRALAAQGGSPAVQQALLREVDRGETFFRSAVIEALGEYKARYAFDALLAIAKLEGPLAGDAVLALGRIGDARALETFAGLQRTGGRSMQPSIAAAICLLGVNCGSHERFLEDTLRFADENVGYQELLRAAAGGLGALGVAGRTEAVDALFAIGIPSRDPTRAPVALALGTVALRNVPLMMEALAQQPAHEPAIALLGEGFDMLEEDLDKERFFAAVRHAYWASAEASPTRQLMQALIGELDF